MSVSLMWEPAKRQANHLPYALKAVLQKAFISLESGRLTMTDNTLPYLHGLRDAGVEGAQELIEAIEKYEAVELWLEY